MRRILAALVAFALSASAASMTCAGWETSASARMACCRAAGDACTDQLAADACCAETEQRQNQTLTAVPSLPASPVAAIAAPPDVFQQSRHASAAAFERAQRRYPHSPPFLSTILLI